MNANQIYQKMIAAAQTLSVDELQIQVTKYMADTSENAGTLFNVLLTALESKMPEADYVAFCGTL